MASNEIAVLCGKTKATACSVVWSGTASVIRPACQRGEYPHMWSGEQRVPACLAVDANGSDVAAVLLPAPDMAAKKVRWITINAEDARCRENGGGDVLTREWETVDGDLIADHDPAIADRIGRALAAAFCG